MFEKDESRNNVAISRGSRIAHGILLLKAPHHPVKRLVGQVAGLLAILPVEICHEPAAHFHVASSTGVMPFIEPVQELLEHVSVWSHRTDLLKPWNA